MVSLTKLELFIGTLVRCFKFGWWMKTIVVVLRESSFSFARSEDYILKFEARKADVQRQNQFVNFALIVTLLICSLCQTWSAKPKLYHKTKQSPTPSVTVVSTSIPVYQVFQPLPLFFILLQLFPPCLPILLCHSLEEPSLTHGFGLKREKRCS